MTGFPFWPNLVGIAVVVAVWFIINTFFVNVFEVQDVWYVLDAFMFAGLVLALGFNARRMASEGTMLPVALGVTGCRMWCDASPSKSNS